jgi:hypothetical protein
MQPKEVKNLFRRQYPDAEQATTMKEIRQMAYKLAATMAINSSEGDEQTLAIRKVYEALMYFDLSVVIGNAKREEQAMLEAVGLTSGPGSET